ncbi:GSCOCG00005124001-RA-CDS [Cotesia congregata]|nr:GSCOCG00005124001-RA-CDS [Cotesia congregata]
MDEVPYDNWYCPECSANDPNMAEEARCLGMTYGRREAGLASQYMSANNFRPLQHRLVPRTRQTERVRASIRATRNRREQVPELVAVSRVFDPDQPSTSSGFDSISENSRGRSPNASSAGNFSHHSRRTASKSKSRSKPTSRKKKTPKRKKAKNNEPVLQKVVIKDYGTDGEEREIVSYVKVKSGTSSRKRKKRSKKTFKRRKNKYHRRACRRIGNIKSVRKRVAIALNMAKKKSTTNPIGLISLTNQSSSVPQRTEQLTNARYRAGIPQLNLFGNNLPLDYCPFGSDDEINPSVSEEDGISGGNVVSVTRRSASSITSLRRRLGLKNQVSRVRRDPHPQPVITDLLDNIISSQELWHSKATKISLKADGTFSLPEKKNKPDIIKNNDFLKDEQSKNDSIIASVTGSADINPDIVQAPMYNNSRGGNNSDGRSFRGNYHNRGHHGHNRNDYGPPRDSYSGNGPPTYGGPGPRDSFGHGDFRQPPPLLDFSPNRRQPHTPGMMNRNRNNPNFRNNPRGRNFNNDRGGFRPLESLQTSNFQPPENFHSQNVTSVNVNTGALPSNVANLSLQDTSPENLTANVDAVVENTSNSGVESAEANPASESAVASSDQPEGEECDIYSDIDMSKPSDNPEGDNKETDDRNSSIEALLPPPIPPSDLLDFEDNLKSDNESDDNDLVIDDTPKEPAKNADTKDGKTDDKYDPFAVIDSDSNDEHPRDSSKKKNQGESSNLDFINSSLPPLEPPPMPPDFSAIVDLGEMKNIKKDSLTLLGTYYNDEDDDNANQDDDDDDDDDDETTKSDCPNFSIYSSETMDVARHAEQELTQQIGPLEPPPMPPLMPDDDDIIVADVQSCDLADIPEPSDPYIESLQKERQTLSKIPTKKLSIDSRGKITFKIGNKSKLNNKLGNLEDRFEDSVTASMEKDKEAKDKEKNKDLKDKEGKIEEAKEKEVKNKDEKEDDDDDDKKKDSGDKEDDKKSKEKEDDKMLKEKVDDEKSKDEDDKKSIEEDDKKSKEKEDENELKEKEIIEEESQKFLLKTNDEDNVDKSKEDDDNSPAVVVVVVESKDKEEEFELIKIDSPEKEKDKDDDKEEVIDENKNKNEDVEIIEVQESVSLNKSTADLEETDELKLRKDNVEVNVEAKCAENEVWESDGAYTPCKDEMPVKESIKLDGSEAAEASFDNGLEPITPPPKDRSTDDLGARCRTPIEYAGLGTEAISETDEPINFEEELTMLSQRKDKEMEDGEVSDENKLSNNSGNNKKHKDKSSDTDNNPESSRKKKKNRRDRNKEASEKNKENISSDNQVEWKKISKSTKERSYREKSKNYESGDKDKSKDKGKYRDRSKDRGKKHGKEDSDKKKVKRKELPRYDVRKIVSEKPVRPRKDEYGRDIRELSLSLSPSRSLTRNRRSHSRLSRSYSPRMNLRKSRSWSRHRARSRERSQNRSSPYKQSLSRSRRKSQTRDRHSLSRRRSRSPTSRRNQRVSPARQHQSRRSKKKSLSRKNRSRTRSWSRSRSRSRVRSRSRSRSRVKSRSRSRVRMRSRSKSRTSSKSPSKTRSRSRGAKKKEKLRKQKSPNWNKISDKDLDHSPFDVREKDQQVSGNAGVSWSAQWTPSWSRSRSRTPAAINKQRDDHMMQSRNWSPTSTPTLDNHVSPKNLTVILRNKDATKSKKKKDKRSKDKKKSRDADRRKGASKRNRTPPPSKEVFASGDNILVSVCFNDNATGQSNNMMNLTDTLPLLTTTKRRRREPVQEEPPPAKKPKKDKSKEKKSRPSPKVSKRDKKRKSKAAEIAATKKPVAVIDLDQSPFREQTLSPQDIIVLSDDDNQEHQLKLLQQKRLKLSEHEQFMIQGPKTPPEPQIKFSISKQQSNLRNMIMHPLFNRDHDELEMEAQDDEDKDKKAKNDGKNSEVIDLCKIGPNTPPEPPNSPLTSPDVYDPFDPTKSRSPTPSVIEEPHLPSEQKHANKGSDLSANNEKQESDKPKVISMVTIKRVSPEKVTPTTKPLDIRIENKSLDHLNQNSAGNLSCFTTINPVLATVAAAVQRSGIFNNPGNYGITQRNINRLSPSSQLKQRGNERPQLSNLFAAKNLGNSRINKAMENRNSAMMTNNGGDLEGNDATIDTSSPYSPGSSLSDGIFDPPSPAKNHSPQRTLPSLSNLSNINKNSGNNVAKNKKDLFDSLFDSSPVVKMNSKMRNLNKKSPDKRKKSGNSKIGVRMDENQLQILDDLPSSAVEMQVKDKFLKKLNRQERVVEEVKLVLKPHYTKKHITKEEYKDIMRKAVPKICHNKSGEINPKKIAQLVEAYVKRCRSNKRKSLPEAKSSATTAATNKNLRLTKTSWS